VIQRPIRSKLVLSKLRPTILSINVTKEAGASQQTNHRDVRQPTVKSKNTNEMPHSRIMQKYVLIRQVLHQIILIVAHLKLETSTAVPMDPGQVHEEAVHQSTPIQVLPMEALTSALLQPMVKYVVEIHELHLGVQWLMVDESLSDYND
jgi:hypothetical protein